MLPFVLWFSCLATVGVLAQSSSSPATVLSGTNAVSITRGDVVPTEATYISYSTTITVSTGTMVAVLSSMGNINSTTSNSRVSSSSAPSVTLLAGRTSTASLINGTMTASSNTTRSSTSSSARPTNTQPCNGYPELCERKYSNITNVVAHNSPFVRPGNIASNQALDVTTQLNDGIRMLQMQTHQVNGTIYLCHTSCHILNAGTLEDYLSTVEAWVATHPYDVLTILIGNADLLRVGSFTQAIQNSGLVPYLYTPPKIPMGLDDWPPLSRMILTGKRVVLFMDYNANQTEVPYILDEFSQMWETPFSPTNKSFPCVVDRPPGLAQDQARERLYIANHNLNLEVSLYGAQILIPNFPEMNDTNSVSGFGSAGLSANQCTSDWGRPPNFLLVDYYNIGSPTNGSVFQVAAYHNNVTYNGRCCGSVSSFGLKSLSLPNLKSAIVITLILALVL